MALLLYTCDTKKGPGCLKATYIHYFPKFGLQETDIQQTHTLLLLTAHFMVLAHSRFLSSSLPSRSTNLWPGAGTITPFSLSCKKSIVLVCTILSSVLTQQQRAAALCCYSPIHLKERVTAKLFTTQKAFSFWKQWLGLVVAAGMCGHMDSCTLASWI